jgi:hypothetical protein
LELQNFRWEKKIKEGFPPPLWFFFCFKETKREKKNLMKRGHFVFSAKDVVTVRTVFRFPRLGLYCETNHEYADAQANHVCCS